MKHSALIVDDQVNWRELLAELLEQEFEVVTANNYAEAIETINQRISAFHVIVTDMRLKDEEAGNEDGLKLIEYPNLDNGFTKRIIVTGYATLKSQRTALAKLKAFDYFEKHPSDGSDFPRSDFVERIRIAAVEAEKRRVDSMHLDVFVLMPFAKEYVDFYENEIKKVIEDMGLICKRVDNFYGPRSIMADILKQIKNARFILADFSGRNPNVFFEVGIAHALGKSVLLLTQNLEDVPPRLRTVRCLVYEQSLAGGNRIAPQLEASVKEIHESNYPRFLEDGEFKPKPRHCLALMPNGVSGRKTFDDLVLRSLKNNRCSGERVEEIFNPVSTLNKIWACIHEAEIIIADLSGRDADVFYLAGLVYGLSKKIIYLAQDPADIPFDIKEGSCLIYALAPYKLGIDAQNKLTQLVGEMIN
jgi:ActR/RegA family two-component response regulator